LLCLTARAQPRAVQAKLNDPDVSVDEYEFEVHRSGTGFDFSVLGGKEHNLPIIVSRVFENGAAHRTGKMAAGDIILAANGVNLENATRNEAVDAIKAGGDSVRIRLRHMQRKPGHAPVERQASGVNEVDGVELVDIFRVSLMRLCVSQFTSADGDLRSSSVVYLRAHDGNAFGVAVHCMNATEATEWFDAIRHQVTVAAGKFAATLTRPDVPPPFTGRVVRVGWLSRNIRGRWRWVFAVLSDYDLALFDGQAPVRSRELARPNLSLDLTKIRVRPLDDEADLVDHRDGCFGVITPQGGLVYLSAEMGDARDAWVADIQAAARSQLSAVNELAFEAEWYGQPVRLVFAGKRGIEVITTAGAVMWRCSLDHIAKTHHDATTISITSQEGQRVDLLVRSPRAVAHYLLNVLSAAVESSA
jgi:gamma-syntrophin